MKKINNNQLKKDQKNWEVRRVIQKPWMAVLAAFLVVPLNGHDFIGPIGLLLLFNRNDDIARLILLTDAALVLFAVPFCFPRLIRLVWLGLFFLGLVWIGWLSECEYIWVSLILSIPFLVFASKFGRLCLRMQRNRTLGRKENEE